ncbi:hypothetical protein PM082_013697 [Marasmius tenuissimus]|nr:hypothetical protein PM082_013697 [Marasmius tenuissimus]
MLYPLVMILHLGLTNSPNPSFDTFPLVVLAAGIAPTLIIVLTHLAIHVVDDSDATYSRNNNFTSFRFTRRSFGLSRAPDEPQVPCAGDGAKAEAFRDREFSERVV